MLKPVDNPPLIYPAGQALSTDGGPWRVAHTKARNEKAFAWDLVTRDVPFFLPMVTHLHVTGGRKYKTIVPLFPSYVFFRGGSEGRLAALATGRVCQIIEARDQRQLVSELADIHRVIQSGVTMHPLPSAAVGSRCRIHSGPLQGIEGTLVRREAGHHFVIHVSMLGQGAELEIEPDLLEPVDDAPAPAARRPRPAEAARDARSPQHAASAIAKSATGTCAVGVRNPDGPLPASTDRSTDGSTAGSTDRSTASPRLDSSNLAAAGNSAWADRTPASPRRHQRAGVA